MTEQQEPQQEVKQDATLEQHQAELKRIAAEIDQLLAWKPEQTDHETHFHRLYTDTLAMLETANVNFKKAPIVAGYPSQWLTVSKTLLANLIKIRGQLKIPCPVDKSEIEEVDE